MNLSRGKILSVLRNIPKQIGFLLQGKASQFQFNEMQTFVSPYGLGDTFILCLMADEWEKVNNRKIHFLIKPTHEFIFKFFKRNDYSIVDMGEIPLYLFAALNSWKKISKKRLFIAHMRFHISFRKDYKKLSSGELNLSHLYQLFLKVPFTSHQLMRPFQENAIQFSSHFTQSLDTKKLVFVSPTANTLKSNHPESWDLLYQELIRRGFSILENATEVNLYSIRGKEKIDISLNDLVVIGFKSELTITFRSGLSDIFHSLGSRLIVLYPDELSLKQYSVCKMYNQKDVKELITDENLSYRILNILRLT